MGEVQFTDRYQALGIPYPDPKTMCKGQCEGTGYVPVYRVEGDTRDMPAKLRAETQDEKPWRTHWRKAEAEEPSGDGWHFVTCPDCKGTRLEAEDARALDDE